MLKCYYILLIGSERQKNNDAYTSATSIDEDYQYSKTKNNKQERIRVAVWKMSFPKSGKRCIYINFTCLAWINIADHFNM